jgi:NAD(P)-dependent dehydrogenase (short-subunit alcohol dehydrogenase family)
MPLRIAVVDGQGGGIGAAIVKRLRDELPEGVEIIALGTNSTATTAMMKARANRGATGENAISRTSQEVDIITGPISIVMANSMLGELTPRMAEAISGSPAEKLLIPMSQERVEVIGVAKEPLPHLIEGLVKKIKEMVK